MSSKKRKIIYFVRHGQSEDNVLPVFQSSQTPLSEKGKRQAESIAKRLMGVDFEALLASPLPRASQTAEQISLRTGKQLEFYDMLVERIKPVSIDGKPWADKQATDTWRAWNESFFSPDKRVEDGENFDDIVARADGVLETLLTRPEQHIVAVTHGYFLRTIIARVILGDNLTPELLRRFQELTFTENTAITVLHHTAAFEEAPRWRVWSLNDHSHFAD